MARSGQLDLAPGTIGTYAPEGWQLLCEVTASSTIKARVLSVRLADLPASSEIIPAEPGVILQAGAWWDGWLQEDQTYGALRITTTGDGGTTRQIWADLRSGEYQLPPCSAAVVEVARYWPGPVDTSPPTVRVNGALSDGVSSDVSPLLLTCARNFFVSGEIEPGQDTADLRAPMGAYAFDLVPWYGASFLESRHGVHRDRTPASGLHFPPAGPIPLVSPQLSITTNTPGSGVCQVVFFVR